MKTLIIVYSYHHNNTEKIANAMAEELKAEVEYPQNVNIEKLEDYDIIGFGAGIDSGKHYKPMLELAENLPKLNNKKAFIFSTAGVGGDRKMKSDHNALRTILQAKGYVIIGEYACRGFNTNSVLKYFGGMNKNKPDMLDLQNAKAFAMEMQLEICSVEHECRNTKKKAHAR